MGTSLNYYDPDTATWKLVDFKNFDTIDNFHFRKYNNKLQYSTDNTNWVDV
jgi:hypothetical protein